MTEREDGERDGDGDDERAAPAAEEEQDHQAGERGGDDGLADDAVDRGADEDGLIAERRDLELRLAGLVTMDLTRGKGIQHAFDYRERGCVPVLRTVMSTPRLAVLADDVGLGNAKPSLTLATSWR